jgi:CRP-like cAMP-binding protein
MFLEFKRYLESKIEISDAQFHELENLLVYRFVKKGEVLLQPGETYSSGYFVMKGLLRSYIVHNGKEHIMQFAPENWWIGDNNGIIKPEPALFFIDAIEDSRVASYDHEFINNMVRIIPQSFSMKQSLQQNAFRSLQHRIIHLLSASAEERYSFFLSKYPNLANRLPQKMIASYLGIAPQSLSRVRANKQAKTMLNK